MANCITRHIPNALTCLNLFSGCIAGVMAFESRYELALLFIIISAVFDFFDGLAARALDAHSPIGKDLDSLADDISFGVAPSLIVFSLFKEMPYPAYMEGTATWLPYSAFLISVFSALRLAKFNNDTRQTTSFIGLPVPANALFWAFVERQQGELPLPVVLRYFPDHFTNTGLCHLHRLVHPAVMVYRPEEINFPSGTIVVVVLSEPT